MAGTWSLVEYRPGRYAKVSSTGEFLGRASEAEVRAWFAAQKSRDLPTTQLRPLVEPEAAPTAEPVRRPTPFELRNLKPFWTEAKPPAREPEAGSSPPDLQAGEPARAETERPAPGPASRPLPSALSSDLYPPARAEFVASPPVAPALPPAAEEPPLDRPPGEVDSAPAWDHTAQDSEEEETAADVGRWLWLDPRQERGYNPAAFDLEAFLRRAMELFRSKAWTGGQKPRRLAVHPDQMADGLRLLAEALGLEVVSDPLVTPGTYRLALAEMGNPALRSSRHTPTSG